DLADEPVQVPQRRLLGLVAEPGPELVVVVVLDARVRQEAVARLQVLVRGARAAVQEEHPQARVVADPLGPDTERALGRFHRDLPGAAAQYVVPARVVEVAACWHGGSLPAGR